MSKIIAVMQTTVTVELDDRGRFTVPLPAREALGIDGQDAKLSLAIRVLKPNDVAGNETTSKRPVDERGRVTISADDKRELEIYGRRAICEIELETTRHLPQSNDD